VFEIAVVALLVAGSAAWIFRAETRPTQRDDLKRSVSELRSLAAETAVLAEQFRDGRLAADLWNAHLELLREKVRDNEKELGKMRPTLEMVSSHGAARVSSSQVTTAMDELAKLGDEPPAPSSDPATKLGKAHDDLTVAASELQELEQSLES